MRVSCIQMDMLLGKEDYNFKHAQDLIRATVAQEHPDVVAKYIILPLFLTERGTVYISTTRFTCSRLPASMSIFSSARINVCASN